jgi:[ribosomal protein S5]-alanine N-acetyltransferase
MDNAMTGLPRLDTARTIVTLLQPEHAPLLLRYQLDNRDHLAPWEGVRDEWFFSIDTAQQRIDNAVRAFEEDRGVTLAALDRAGGDIVALCGFSNIVRGLFQACHMGYSVARRHEGQGLMREVAEAGIGYMFDVAGLHRIMANYMPANTRSARLLERLGFEREGMARAYLKIAEKWEDHVLTARINPKG